MVGLPDDFLEWVRTKGICGGVGGVVVTGVSSSEKEAGLGNSTYVGRSINRGLVVSVDDFSSRGGCLVELPWELEDVIVETCVPVDGSPIVRVSTGEFESRLDTINSTRPPVGCD